MTDRPRAWTLVTCPDCGDGRLAHEIDGGPVHVVEWDREKVEAAITLALEEAFGWRRYGADPRDLARAIFDALDPEGAA